MPVLPVWPFRDRYRGGEEQLRLLGRSSLQQVSLALLLQLLFVVQVIVEGDVVRNAVIQSVADATSGSRRASSARMASGPCARAACRCRRSSAVRCRSARRAATFEDPRGNSPLAGGSSACGRLPRSACSTLLRRSDGWRPDREVDGVALVGHLVERKEPEVALLAVRMPSRSARRPTHAGCRATACFRDAPRRHTARGLRRSARPAPPAHP